MSLEWMVLSFLFFLVAIPISATMVGYRKEKTKRLRESLPSDRVTRILMKMRVLAEWSWENNNGSYKSYLYGVLRDETGADFLEVRLYPVSNKKGSPLEKGHIDLYGVREHTCGSIRDITQRIWREFHPDFKEEAQRRRRLEEWLEPVSAEEGQLSVVEEGKLALVGNGGWEKEVGDEYDSTLGPEKLEDYL